MILPPRFVLKSRVAPGNIFLSGNLRVWTFRPKRLVTVRLPMGFICKSPRLIIEVMSSTGPYSLNFLPDILSTLALS